MSQISLNWPKIMPNQTKFSQKNLIFQVMHIFNNVELKSIGKCTQPDPRDLVFMLNPRWGKVSLLIIIVKGRDLYFYAEILD